MLEQAFSPKFIILYLFILSALYTHFRGKVRFKFLRQLADHSTFMAPINSIMYLFSAVPNQPFLDLKQFPNLAPLRENWQIIRDEAQHLVSQGYIKSSEKRDDIGFNSFFRTGWKRFYLKWYDEFLPSAVESCPKTIALLKEIPSINAAMFALLPKNGRLVTHRDPYAGSLRYHLGLITPNSEKCRIFVDGIEYYWKNGEDIIFDETFIHYAENESDQDRIILFCDVERPLKNKIAAKFNYFFSKYVMSGSATQNLAIDRVGFINKIFKYLYAIRLVGKRLKKFNKPFYYLVKYCLFISIFYLLFF
jgi:beta-hydroxylase